MTMREQDQFSGQSGPRDTVELAQNKAGEVKEQLQEKASEMVSRVQEQATSQIAMQKEKAVSTLGSVSGALRQTSQTLRDQDQAPFAQFADKAAEQIDNLTSYLQNHEPQELLTEVERFARKQPALFIGGAFVLGLLGARFLKSSAESQQREMYERQYGPGGGSYNSYGRNYSTGYGYNSPQMGSSNMGQYGNQYGDRQGGQYGGEQYTSYPRTYEGGADSSLRSGDTFGTSGQRSRQAGGDMLFGQDAEER
jgi:hypothetical protein